MLVCRLQGILWRSFRSALQMTTGHRAMTVPKAFAGFSVLLAVVAFVALMVAAIRQAHSAEPCAKRDAEYTFSWYGPGQGTATASGEEFRPNLLTAAHRKCPFGTRLRVTYRGRSVVVRVNDKGPFVIGRALDISEGAARVLGIIERGVVRGRIEVVK